MAEKITNFFDKLPKDALIRWISTPQPAKKCVKWGPGRPRKVRNPETVMIDLDLVDSDLVGWGAVTSQTESDDEAEPSKIRP